MSRLTIDGNNTNHGTQVIGVQNTYVLEQIVSTTDCVERLGDDLAHYLKPMPVLDIDTGVAFALYPERLHNLISDKNQQVTAFIPHSHNTFGVQLPQSIEGVTPSILLRDDILLIEPCIRPRSGDLVLVCLEYETYNRGLIARLQIGFGGKPMIKHNQSEFVPMPAMSLICGVVVAIKRRTIDNAGLVARIDPKWNILDTLVLEE